MAQNHGKSNFEGFQGLGRLKMTENRKEMARIDEKLNFCGFSGAEMLKTPPKSQENGPD